MTIQEQLRSKKNSDIRKKRLMFARLNGSHTKEEWLKMKAFFSVCVICRGNSNLINVEKDHIIPLYQGGSDSIRNIQPLCARCNASKGPENEDHRVKFCEDKGIILPLEWRSK